MARIAYEVLCTSIKSPLYPVRLPRGMLNDWLEMKETGIGVCVCVCAHTIPFISVYLFTYQ